MSSDISISSSDEEDLLNYQPFASQTTISSTSTEIQSNQSLDRNWMNENLDDEMEHALGMYMSTNINVFYLYYFIPFIIMN